ncbi:MAG: 6-hydroxycyclohex-1-ene-1-carbonyl-CoA dehydrogenase [Acidobacteriota bacterium]
MAWTGTAWQLVEPGKPLVRKTFRAPDPEADEAVVAVAGCGVCHTDIGFIHGGVRTRQALPLTLGHEVAGCIVALGSAAGAAEIGIGQDVIIPAVLPCGACDWCAAGRQNICPDQKMPGNDLDGGFASHVVVPSRFLVPVPRRPDGLDLAHLAVVADAVTTPLQALRRASVGAGDSVVVIGVGGIGIHAVQIAAAWQASVLAVDISAARLDRARRFGAAGAVRTEGLDDRAAREAVRTAAADAGWPARGAKIFEMSGTATGQRLAWSLLTPGATLAVVGYTRDKISCRLSNLMAFDAEAFGSWGCPPSLYPEALALIVERRIRVEPFVSFHPLDDVNTVIEKCHRSELSTRPVLTPGEESS